MPFSNVIRSGRKAPPSKMPAKKMRTAIIKVEDGEEEVEADKGQEEAGVRGVSSVVAQIRAQLLRMRRDIVGVLMRRRMRRRFERWSRRE